MSAGSSNSQDSFPAPGAAANASIDGYPGYPSGYPGTAGPQPDYGAGGGQMQRPPSQSNAQTPHAGKYKQSHFPLFFKTTVISTVRICSTFLHHSFFYTNISYNYYVLTNNRKLKRKKIVTIFSFTNNNYNQHGSNLNRF